MATKLVTITAAGTDATVVTVPANKIYKVTGIIITNRASANAVVEVYDGPSASGELKLKVIAETGKTVAFGEVKPEFSTSIVVKSDQADVDVMVEYEER